MPPPRWGERFSVAQDGAGSVIAAGEIDLGTSRVLREVLQGAGQGPQPLVIDLVEVQYLHSAGVGVLFDQALRGPLILRVRTGSVLATVVRICGLPHVAEVEFVPAD